jgi:hypothetical protein
MEKGECCPKFNPEPWDRKTFRWDDKRFIKARVRTFFFIPLNFGAVMKALDAKVRAAGGNFAESIGLSDHTSRWNMDVLVSTDREIPGAENVVLSGDFISKVYEGPFSDTRKWCADFESFVAEKKKSVRKWYMWYTTCPKCAKRYGKNYTVIIGQTG